MRSTHEFHSLLRSVNVTRTQALRLAGAERAVRLHNSAMEASLRALADAREHITLIVGNHGMIQSYSGALNRIVRANGWLNVLDPGFNLHARDEAITESWLLLMPTADGPVRSLEFFDASGGTVAMLFEKRREGEATTPTGFARIVDALARDAS